MMNRSLLLVVGFSTLFSAAASGQSVAIGPIRGSMAREATRLASTSSVPNRLANRAAWGDAEVLQRPQEDDWEAVRQLRTGTHVVISTTQNERIGGRLSAAGDGTLQVVDREGEDKTLRREDVREVRLDHRLSTSQYVGLGLAVGGGAGLAFGHAAECGDCELRGLGTTMGGIGGTVMGLLSGWMIGSHVNAQPGRLVYRRPAS